MEQHFFENGLFLGKYAYTYFRNDHDDIDAVLEFGRVFLRPQRCYKDDEIYVFGYTMYEDSPEENVFGLFEETRKYMQGKGLEELSNSVYRMFEFELKGNNFEGTKEIAPKIFDGVISELEEKIGVKRRDEKNPKELYALLRLNENLAVGMFNQVFANVPYVFLEANNKCGKEDFEKAVAIVGNYLRSREELVVEPNKNYRGGFSIHFSPHKTFEMPLRGMILMKYDRLMNNTNELGIKSKEELNNIVIKEGIEQMRVDMINPEFRNSFTKNLRGRPLSIIREERLKKLQAMVSITMDDENLIIKSKNAPEPEEDIPEITEADLEKMFPTLPPQKFSAKLNHEQRGDYKRLKDIFETMQRREMGEIVLNFDYLLINYGIDSLMDEVEQKKEFMENKQKISVN